jgi:ribosomal protein S8
VLILYQDNVETERVDIYSLKTKPDMHAMLQDKGFVHKPKIVQEVVVPEERRIEQDLKVVLETGASSILETKPVYDSMMRIYGATGALLLFFGIWIYRRRKPKRKL